MAGVRSTITDAQYQARTNHYLEKVGRGKPKAKGTKNNPLKNKDLALMLKDRFGNKNKTGAANNNNGADALKQQALKNAENINKPSVITSAQLDKQFGIGQTNSKPASYADDFAKLLDEKYGKLPSNEPKTWAKYAEEHGTKYEQPKSGVIEADKKAAEAIKQNEAKAPKTWAKYAEEHGTKYNQPISGVVDADKKATEAIKQQNLKQQALKNAEAINKPAVVTADQLDKQFGIGNKKPVDPKYADDFAKLLDEQQAKQGVKPASKAAAKAGGAVGALADDVVEQASKNKSKSGFFSKVGNFFKGKGGKLALAGAAIAGLALLLNKCGGKKDEPVPPTPTPVPTPEPTPTPQPQEDKYGVEKEEGKMPKSYTIQAGNYPSGIIADTYGVAYGTPEFKEIQKAVYEASGYERNTNLKVGDKFTLPDVTIGDKTYTADENAKVRTGEIVDNGLKLGRTKEVVKAGDKFYITHSENGQRVAGEQAFDSEEAARARISELENTEDEVQQAA